MFTKRATTWRLALVLVLVATLATAQEVTSEPQTEPQVVPEPLVDEEPTPDERVTSPTPSSETTIVRVFGDYTVMEGDSVREVVVVAGSATIEGRVDRDVVVILGMATLSDTADLRGSLVVIGGSATVAPGARIDRDLVVVAGSLEGPPGFAAGRQQTVIGPTMLGDGVRAAVPWVTNGALWGRPIAPAMPWVWGIVAIFALIYLTLNIVFGRAVTASVELLHERPFRALFVGVLVLMLVGPVTFVLGVSVVGIVLVPVLLCAVVVAALFGKVAVARWIGSRVVSESEPDNRVLSSRSVVIGLVLITLVYLVPILGFVAWTTLGVFGLGAATTTLILALRPEHAPVPTLDTERGGPLPSVPGVAGETPAAPDVIADAASANLIAFPHAMFLQRLAALALDFVLVVLAGVMLNLDNPGQFFVLLLGYHIVFWGWKGTTLGGIICQLRIVRTSGKSLRFADALVRGLAGIFSVAVFGLGFFWILIDGDRQSWHDKIAGTYVVRVPKDWPLP